MKKLIIFCVEVALLFFLSACNTSTTSEKSIPTIVGTWEYTGDMEGMAILTEKEFIFIGSSKAGSPSSDSLTDAAKLERFNNLIVAGGTHNIQDSLVTCLTKYNINPNYIGQTWKWTYSLTGDDLHWKTIDDTGKVINEGDCKRMKSL